MCWTLTIIHLFIGDITRKFLNGDISKDKFIRQLSAATEIYLTE